jgi:hypothetical protein
MIYLSGRWIFVMNETACWYIIWSMKKTLLATNPHLKDAASRERTLARNIESSSAIEGIRVKRDAASGRFLTAKNDAAPSAPVIRKKAR